LNKEYEEAFEDDVVYLLEEVAIAEIEEDEEEA
jgi:hypothetical protein